MSIISTQIVDDPGGTTRFIRVDYTAHTGEVFRRTLLVTGSAASAVSAAEPDVLYMLEEHEAELYDDAVSEGADPLTMPDPEHGTGTVQEQKNKIWRRWLKKAYFERDPWFLRHLIPFIDWLLATYSIAAIKQNLGISDAAWTLLADRYTNLKNNSTVFDADVSGDLDA